MESSAPTLVHTATAVAELGACPADFAALDDAGLLKAQQRHSALKHQVDIHGAWIAGEVARRSTRELGYAGLAQRQGFFSPEELIQSMSKSSRSEAAKLIRAGLLMAETHAAEQLAVDQLAAVNAADSAVASLTSALPWHAPIAHAVGTGMLSLDAAEPIRTILAEVADRVPSEILRDACERLIADAATRNADQMYRRARQIRDQIDETGISGREARQYGERSMRVWERRDGMIQTNLIAHPEEGEPLLAWYHETLGPRRGGPRIADPAARQAAKALLDDPRTNEQIAADSFFDLFRAALDINPATMVGHRRPSVRIIVTEHAIRAATSGTNNDTPVATHSETPVGTEPETRSGHPVDTRSADPIDSPAGTQIDSRASMPLPAPGHGRIEGVLDPVSIATIQRYLCDTGAVPVAFDDDGQCVNVGRDQRLFTSKQRIALAVRDGGCMFGNCGRPPAFCEAHHINYWARDRGKTNVADGILLCRRHHLLVHNNGWEIIRERGTYWLIPPRAIDPDQNRIHLPSKNPDMWDLGFRLTTGRRS
jgi:hypothetical protein